MKKIITLASLLIFSFIVNAQKTIKEWSELDEKKFSKKFQYNSGMDLIKKFIKSKEQMPKLNTVGVLSYAMYQPNFTPRGSAYITFLTDAGEACVVDILFQKAYDGMMAACKKDNIVLLTPPQYQNSDEKRASYQNVVFEESGLTKAVTNIAHYFGGSVSGYDGKAAPSGYKFLMETNMDAKLWRAIGDFAGKMEVDALINIEQTVWWNGKFFALGPIKINFIGPNPIPYDKEEKRYAPLGPLKGYLEGIIYGSVTLDPPEPYKFADIGKKKLENINLEGLDVVYERIVTDLIAYIKTEIAKTFE